MVIELAPAEPSTDAGGEPSRRRWVAIVAALVVAAAAGFLAGRPSVNKPAPQPAVHTYVIATTGSSALVVRQGINGERDSLPLRAGGTFQTANLKAVTVAVMAGPGQEASCSISVDGVIADTESASGGSAAGQAICTWAR